MAVWWNGRQLVVLHFFVLHCNPPLGCFDKMTWPAATRARLVELYLTTHSYVVAQRTFRREQGVRQAPRRDTIQRWVAEFRSSGSVARRQPRRRTPRVRTPAVVQRVRQALHRRPVGSIRRLARRQGMSYGTTRTILREDLHLAPYRLQVTQALKRGDKSKRLEFCTWFLQRLRVRPRFNEVLYMSDEANFYLNGLVNKYNCRVWALENPHATVQHEMQAAHLTVWCALSSTRVIGPFFFQETVTASRYAAMLEQFFFPALQRAGVPLSRVWFQQDGATPHTSRIALSALENFFGQRVISKGAAVRWPPRSPDLSVVDFFFWGHVKNTVYSTSPSSLQQLKRRIIQAIRAIPQNMLHDAFEACVLRCQRCKRLRGGHVEATL